LKYGTPEKRFACASTKLLLEMDEIKLRFTQDAMRAVAREAVNAKAEPADCVPSWKIL
jgi:ATP-dependent protease Clp ATPase subunit